MKTTERDRVELKAIVRQEVSVGWPMTVLNNLLDDLDSALCEAERLRAGEAALRAELAKERERAERDAAYCSLRAELARKDAAHHVEMQSFTRGMLTELSQRDNALAECRRIAERFDGAGHWEDCPVVDVEPDELTDDDWARCCCTIGAMRKIAALAPPPAPPAATKSEPKRAPVLIHRNERGQIDGTVTVEHAPRPEPRAESDECEKAALWFWTNELQESSAYMPASFPALLRARDAETRRATLEQLHAQLGRCEDHSSFQSHCARCVIEKELGHT